MASLARIIRAARFQRGLTQGDLAARIGVSQGTISFWENGVEMPAVENLIVLALELPEIIEGFQGRERELLQRILQLERGLFGGGCACQGCGCDSEARAGAEPSAETMGRRIRA